MNKAYWLKENQLIEDSLNQFFSFVSEKDHIIAIVGAGGKTTLMYYLAEQFCRKGMQTAVTTTTHIFTPEHCPVCHTLGECQMRWNQQQYAVWGKPQENGKLGALDTEEFHQLLELADVTLVEADGAKRMACKVPASHEPVIPEEADIVIGVVGLDVLGQPIETACFRAEQAAALLGCDGKHILTLEDLVTILQSEKGTRKNVENREYYVVLNKCDDEIRKRQGEQILRRFGDKAVMTFFAEEYRK